MSVFSSDQVPEYCPVHLMLFANRSCGHWILDTYFMYDLDMVFGNEAIKMMRVSAGELQRQWGRVQDMALAEPVTVTCKGRDRMVLLSVEEYQRLKQRDRQVMSLDEFTDHDIAALEAARIPADAAIFNHEVTE